MCLQAELRTFAPDVDLRETILGHVVRRDQELLIDTRGTLEEDSDDQFHSVDIAKVVRFYQQFRC